MGCLQSRSNGTRNGTSYKDGRNIQGKIYTRKSTYITEEKDLDDSPFVSIALVNTVSPSVCKIPQMGTAFLGKFLYHNKFVYGLFTNNHVLNEEKLDDKEEYVILEFESPQFGKQEKKLSLKNTFRFTCPVLDVTFIQIDEEKQREFKNFLELRFEWMGKKGDKILVMQNPQSLSDEGM